MLNSSAVPRQDAFEVTALQEGMQETSRLLKFPDNTEEKQHSFSAQGFLWLHRVSGRGKGQMQLPYTN